MARQQNVALHDPIARLYTSDNDSLPGFDTLQRHNTSPDPYIGFSPNTAYADYMNIHKVFVGHSGGRRLIEIAKALQHEWLPDYLNAGGWAAAEAGLVCDNLDAVSRIDLLNTAEYCWETALTNQETLRHNTDHSYLNEDTDQFRIALNLAFAPIMKSIIVGDVTRTVRERTFADTLAIAQLNSIQLNLASKEGDIDAVGDHLGLSHECNALLTLLYLNDPNYIPIPSTYRAGSGYEYRSQTHDITVINQHWGTIQRILPAEIKAAASFRDKQRYKALIIRGKMHLAIPGQHHPLTTTDAFAQCFEGNPSDDAQAIVTHATTTVKHLFSLYQKGECPDEFKKIRTNTEFHTTDQLAAIYREFSPIRRTR
ncbi:MAG: hypothetical protein WAS27_04440 [Candidatus Saccharimonadales bacterium]